MSVEEHTSGSGGRHDGIRDTIDSIVVAFILAFVFRAFVVEAFVIPTGSMAPTLYGAHGQHRCLNCGYTYAYGVQEDVVQQRYNVVCPNCGHYDYVEGARLPMVADNGDRILVLKWPFDVGGEWLGPARWDVVVFKDPKDGKQNYIKRLVGMPGEVLEVIDGDVYAAPAEQVPQAVREKLLRDPLSGTGRDLTEADLRAVRGALRIQRKPSAAQESLWMVHYDHDYPPLQRHEDSPYWDAGGTIEQTGWNAETPVVTFDGRDDAEHPLELGGRPITDFYGYNSKMASLATVRHQMRYVGDARLRFVLTPGRAAGALSLMLSKRGDEFRATLSGDGKATLARRRAGRQQPWQTIASGRTDALAAERPVRVEFENVDYRVALRIDGPEVVATRDEDYRPDLDWLGRRSDGDGPPSQAAIAARGMPLTIRHLAVDRDVFYRSVPFAGDNEGDNPFAARGLQGWGTASNPIYLREGEYFVCGDNSPQSKDSRLWWERGAFAMRRGTAYQYGTVPSDQMIGRAFFVYWPAGHRLGERGLPVIPNVGRMRVIR